MLNFSQIVQMKKQNHLIIFGTVQLNCSFNIFVKTEFLLFFAQDRFFLNSVDLK